MYIPMWAACGSQLGSILGGVVEPTWQQTGIKSVQKSIQKVIENMLTCSMAPRLGQFKIGDPLFLEPMFAFGAILGPRWPRDLSKRASGTDFG